MRKRIFPVSAVALALAAAACGGGEEAAPASSPRAAASPTAQAPACSPSGTTLEITAKNTQFDTDCLAAPANQAFTIAFQNEDGGTPHNVAIESDTGLETFFTGKVISGVKAINYDVTALPAGAYRFQCDVHPQVMNGMFVVA